MQNTTIAFIGAGNMAQALIGGLIKTGFPAANIWASDPKPSHLAELESRWGINTHSDNAELVSAADVVVLAVKPQVMQSVLLGLQADLAQHKPLLISIAAGISVASLQQWSGTDLAIVRCMPNTPSLLGSGASGLFANAAVNAAQRQNSEEIFRAVGLCLWIEEEEQIHAVTAVSGSGPAYYFLVMEAMINAGTALGLSKESATELCIQTALGAAQMAQHSEVEPAELRRRVTSPKGTTEQAILSLEADKLEESFLKAMQACAQRSVTLGEELSR